MSFIYLASPYTDKSDLIMHDRYLKVLEVTAQFQRYGITVYSPIVHNHDMAKRHRMPKDSEFWAKHNENMLRAALIMYVLELEGWEKSTGIAKEIKFCRKHGVPWRQLSYPLDRLPLPIIPKK